MLVLMFHANGTIYLDKYYGSEPFPAARFGYAGVDFFFVLSGFLMTHLHWDEIGEADAARQFYVKRFFRIYPAYWLTIIPVIAFISLTRRNSSLAEGVLSAFLIPISTDDWLAVSWTLKHEVLFYCMFGVLLANRTIGLVALGLWLTGNLLFLVSPPPWEHMRIAFSAHNLLFFGGIGVGLANRRLRPPSWLLLLSLAAAIVLAVAVVSLQYPAGSPPLTLAFGACSALAVFAAAALERHHQLKTPRPLIILGDASYSLYLIHFPLISALLQVWFAIGLEKFVSPLAAFALMVAITCAASVLLHLMVEKPLMELINRGTRATVVREISAPPAAS